MKRKVIPKMVMMFLLASTLVVTFKGAPASGHVGDALTAWTSTPPTIDGLISPADEWDGAAQVSVFTGPYEGSVFYVMNDANNLYLALQVVDSTFEVGDMMEVRFDNDHNALISHRDDEILATTTEFRDRHFRAQVPAWGIPDPQIGGSRDGSSAAGNFDGTNFFEMTHPLNSGDPHDFSLSAGDIVGFCLSYYDGYQCHGAGVYPPNSRYAVNEQRLYGDIMIALPLAATIDVKPETFVLQGKAPWISAYIELPSDYDVGEIDRASIELSCDVTGGSNAYTAGVDLTAPTRIGDYDGDGVPDLMVMFDRLALIDYLQTWSSAADGTFYDLPITVTGIVSGTPFEGADAVKVRT